MDIQEPPAGYVDTGSPELSADVGQEQCVTETQHERNERERKKIIEACGLADSDDDETNETVQPQTSAPNIIDTWRTRFSRYKPDPNYNSTAVCHAPIYNLTYYINLELITSTIKGAPAPSKDKNPLSPQPTFIKNKHKKIQLQRRQSVVDLPNAEHGYDYGLPDDDSS